MVFISTKCPTNKYSTASMILRSLNNCQRMKQNYYMHTPYQFDISFGKENQRMNTYAYYQKTITQDCKHDNAQTTYDSDIVHQLHVILHMKRCTVILLLRKGVKPVLGRQLSNSPRQMMALLHFLTNKYFFHKEKFFSFRIC